MDPMFGVDYSFNPNDEQTGDNPLYPLTSLRPSSDGMVQNTVKHNWYFGMRYDFDFTVGDYTGPMDYYFRGDDDFWLYIDGILVKDVDLGGIHNARGAYVDMRDWMERNKTKIKNDKGLNTNHTMTVFFMERGGTGSCCYMSFTLPNARSKPNPGTPTTKVIVKKEWQDNKPTDTHPSIKVQLYRSKENPGNSDKWDDKYEAYASPMTLDSSNNWTCEWPDLIKFKSDGKTPFEYRIKEDTKLVDYLARYDESPNGTTKTFTITNVSSIKIPVEKKWENDGDGTGKRPKEIEVQLYRQLEGENEEEVPINEKNKNESGKIKLSDENNWKFIWELPLYVKKDGAWKKVTYTRVKEVHGEWLENSIDKNGWYEALSTGDENQGFTITNTFNDEFSIDIPITKECLDLGVNDKPTFNFEVKQADNVNIDAENNISYGSVSDVLQTVPITIENVNGQTSTNKNFTLKYNVKDFSALPNLNTTSRYYEIREKPDNSNFIYDISAYVLEVVIRKDAQGKLTATLERVWKGSEKASELYFDLNNPSFSSGAGKNEFIKFTNRKIVKLEITKDVSTGGKDVLTDSLQNYEFEFSAEITLPNGMQSFELPSSDISNEWYGTPGALKGFSIVENKNGITKVSFFLKHGEKVIIPVPIGSEIKIEEDKESHKGYSVSYIANEINADGTKGNDISLPNSGNGDITTIGANITIEISGKNLAIGVKCSNKTGAILPDTGGPGLLMMNRLGWMLLLLALLMAGMEIQFYGERRNRKAATVQREDSRGFDPDDY